MAKKKGRGWHGDSKRHSIAAKKGGRRTLNKRRRAGEKAVGISRPSGPGRKAAGSAFKKAYKEARSSQKRSIGGKQPKLLGSAGRSHAIRAGLSAAKKASSTGASRMIQSYAASKAKKMGYKKRSQIMDVVRGYSRSL